MKNNKFDRCVFICGASRSGTTLFANLLDGHSDNFVFPLEMQMPLYWIWYQNNEANLRRFFLRDYFSTTDMCFFIEEATRRQFLDYMRNQYGSKDVFNFEQYDPEDFIQNYTSFINGHGFNLENLYRAVARAVMPDQANQKNFIVKRPRDNEACATFLAEKIPTAKFIHIIRDPRTRYNSAKMASIAKLWGISYYRDNQIYKTDFATHQAGETMLSMELAKYNRYVLGNKYLIVKYEDYTENPERQMRKVAEFLDIKFEDILLRQTSFGKEISPASSQQKAMKAGIKRSHDGRVKSFLKNTSCLEREILYFFTWDVAHYFGYTDIPIVDYIPRRKHFSLLKYEAVGDYFRTRKKMLKYLRGSSSVTRKFLYHDMLNDLFRGEWDANFFTNFKKPINR